MKKFNKSLIILSTSLLLGEIIAPSVSEITTSADSNDVTSQQTTSSNGSLNDMMIQVFGDSSYTPESNNLTDSQRQQVIDIENKIINNIDPQYFNDPEYSNQLVTNIEKRGKAGLTAKVAAKLLKAGLKKMGQKEYDRLAKYTGLAMVDLNWKAINKVADIFAGFGGTIESALKKSLKSVGLNDYWAGVAARVIDTVFF